MAHSALPGLRVQEGSTLNVLNCEVRRCLENCLEADTSSNINIRGSSLVGSGQTAAENPPKAVTPKSGLATRSSAVAGMVLRGGSKANVAKSLWKDHLTAVAAYNSDLVFESNCVLDIGDKTKEAGEQLFCLARHFYFCFCRRFPLLKIKLTNKSAEKKILNQQWTLDFYF